jgi:hypothetical protein
MSHSPDATIDAPEFGNWRRSSRCGSNGCVEVATANGVIGVRDSKKADSPVLTFDAQEWRAFVDGVKNAEFDI